jgi:hypothetical protein
MLVEADEAMSRYASVSGAPGRNRTVFQAFEKL